jgi:tRNA(Ile)-lysidine synthase
MRERPVRARYHPGMELSPDYVLSRVRALEPHASGYWVAFSGGLDSQALLHLLARARPPVRLGALHVNHNLQAGAAAWAEQCRATCAALQVEYRELSVQVPTTAGLSPEAAARTARYRAFAEALPAGHALVTGHHQDDQAETLLLQLLRGAGPKGLAAMPPVSGFGAGWLVRPLLDVSRAALHAYAQRQALRWVDDPSNAELGFDRNFLRHAVLPLVRERWPATAAVLTRSAGHQAEAAQLLDELAAIDLQEIRRARADIPAGAGVVMESDSPTEADAVAADRLSVTGLMQLSVARRANLLRYWLHRRYAPTPSTAVLERVDQDLLRAAVDAQPEVRWGGVCLRRYRDDLFLLHETIAPECAPVDWPADQPLILPTGVLTPHPGPGRGVAARHLRGRRLRIAFRQGGERLRPAGRREHHSLKHLFQEAGVPPWERTYVPLLYLGDDLIAVAGYWIVEGFQALEQEPGVAFSWRRAIVPSGPIW